MPKKLLFEVIHVSGHDEGYSGKELEVSAKHLFSYFFEFMLCVKYVAHFYEKKRRKHFLFFYFSYNFSCLFLLLTLCAEHI